MKKLKKGINKRNSENYLDWQGLTKEQVATLRALARQGAQWADVWVRSSGKVVARYKVEVIDDRRELGSNYHVVVFYRNVTIHKNGVYTHTYEREHASAIGHPIGGIMRPGI